MHCIVRVWKIFSHENRFKLKQRPNHDPCITVSLKRLRCNRYLDFGRLSRVGGKSSGGTLVSDSLLLLQRSLPELYAINNDSSLLRFAFFEFIAITIEFHLPHELTVRFSALKKYALESTYLIWRMKKIAFSIPSNRHQCPVRCNNTKPFLISQTNRTHPFTEATPTLIFVSHCTLKRNHPGITQRNSQAEYSFGQPFLSPSRAVRFQFYYFYGRVSLFPLLSHLGDIFCLVPRALANLQKVLESTWIKIF